MTPNCYKCRWRSKAPGSAHSRCNHPAYKELWDDNILSVLSTFSSVGRLPGFQTNIDGIKVVGNPRGIANGWFNHPFDFDPTWLVECSGFEEMVKVVV